ncbi:MAG: universal stress protein [Pyrinomonadaceae bacterium]
MRILIPYDGTTNAENALHELHNPDFGMDDEILVVITDVFMAESLEEISRTRRKRRLDFESTGTSSYAPARIEAEEERFLALEIRDRLSLKHSSLNIKVETLPGSSLVSNELLEKAARWKPDLIILGAEKREPDNRFGEYKSGIWRIAAEVQFPVRIVYGSAAGRETVSKWRRSKTAFKDMRVAQTNKSVSDAVSYQQAAVKNFGSRNGLDKQHFPRNTQPFHDRSRSGTSKQLS